MPSKPKEKSSLANLLENPDPTLLCQLLNQSSLAIGFKNKDLVYTAVNQNALNYLGLGNVNDIYSRSFTDYDIKGKAAEAAPLFEKSEKAIIQNGVKQKGIGYYAYGNDDWKMVVGEKFPIIDNQKIIQGVGLCSMDITDCQPKVGLLLPQADNKFHNYRQHKQAYYSLQESYNPDLGLSKRQTECLFFLIRGKTAKETARLLNLSYRTVEFYIDNIKNKLGVHNRSQLIEKALQNGYMSIIPESLWDSKTLIQGIK